MAHARTSPLWQWCKHSPLPSSCTMGTTTYFPGQRHAGQQHSSKTKAKHMQGIGKTTTHWYSVYRENSAILKVRKHAFYSIAKSSVMKWERSGVSSLFEITSEFVVLGWPYNVGAWLYYDLQRAQNGPLACHWPAITWTRHPLIYKLL